MRLAPIGAPGASHLTRRLFAVLRTGREGAPRLSVLTPVPEIVDALNAYRPEVPPVIDVRTVDALEREPGPAAKLKLVKAL